MGRLQWAREGLSCVQIRLVNVCMLRNIYNYDGANCTEPSGALEITTKIQRLIEPNCQKPQFQRVDEAVIYTYLSARMNCRNTFSRNCINLLRGNKIMLNSK